MFKLWLIQFILNFVFLIIFIIIYNKKKNLKPTCENCKYLYRKGGGIYRYNCGYKVEKGKSRYIDEFDRRPKICRYHEFKEIKQ